MDVYSKCKMKVLYEMNVNGEKGLTKEQVIENARRYGTNEFTRAQKVTLARRIFDSAKEPMILMLILAGFIALGVNLIRGVTGGETDFLEVVGIFIAIFLSVIITVIMEGKSAKAFETLNKINEDIKIKVIRDNKVQMILKKDVVVGDIIFLETGDKLPADGRILNSVDLRVNESALTGESEPIKKSADTILKEETPIAERINMLYAGCFITSGSGEMIVTAIGDKTEFGKIAKELAITNKGNTPLQEKLNKLGKIITILGTAMAAMVFIIQVIIFINNGTANIEIISNAFITSIVLIVAAVPEGLPTIVAVSLAINIIKMSKQNSLVKKMIACETIGCINIVCSDKTGTLTKNKMTVSKIFDTNQLIEPRALQNEHLINNFAINSTANIKMDNGSIEFIGNPTECALITNLHTIGISYNSLRRLAKIEHVYPFSSEIKNMTTIIKQDNYIIYTKGSPEKILDMCDVSDKQKIQIEREIIKLQEKAYRVIAFAHKETRDSFDYHEDREKIESNLIYDGFVAINDPLREDVLEAVDKCKKAGIELKMITGDNIVTATAIANELHLLDGSYRVVESSELESLSDEELANALSQIRVIARSTPKIKMRIVNALKSKGNVVAVTGDGINDAPAIKNADVGIAMGISGTEVSKEASDIVLLDDSFSTIIKAVKWGRGIYENFQRFIQFQLTVNLSSVITVLVSIIAGFKSPFTALQLLWINIIMDGPPALTLGLEPIREDLMSRKPTKRNSSIISKQMLTKIIINGLYISVIFLLQTVFNFLGGTEEQIPTILFTLFVVFQLFNAFNCRELGNKSILKNITNNKLMLFVFGIVFSLQIAIIQFGGAFFGTVALPFSLWIKIILVSFTVLILSETVRLIERTVKKQYKFNS